jgi:hypothetical protein
LTEEGTMSSRYDFVKDPQDRRWIARWQLASAAMFVALLVAMIVYGPTQEEAVAGADGGRPQAVQPDPLPVGRAEGA